MRWKNNKYITLPKTNIAAENRSSQKETSLPTIHFQVLLLFVSGRVPNRNPDWWITATPLKYIRIGYMNFPNQWGKTSPSTLPENKAIPKT